MTLRNKKNSLLIIFDFDGVLVDSKEAYALQMQETVETLIQKKIPEEELRVRVGNTDQKQDFITHFRVSEKSVKRAVFNGLEPGSIIRLLKKHTRTPLPQNVEFSIQDWENSVANMSLSRAVLLEAEDKVTMRKVKALAPIKKLMDRQISPTVIVLKKEPSRKSLVKQLRELGIHLK